MQPHLGFLTGDAVKKLSEASVHSVEIVIFFNFVDKTAKCVSSCFCCEGTFG